MTDKRTRQFGGAFRAFLPDDMLEQMAEINNDRLTEEQREVIEVIRDGFSKLSEMQKRVILLMVDQDLSERKVAKMLGIGYPTVLNHLNRARKKLKDHVMQNASGSIYIAGILKEKKANEAEICESSSDDTDESHRS